MSTKRKRAGKAIDDGTAPADVVAVNDRLPSRLFATDRYPTLQLWAFEAIPALLDRLGGDDSVTLLSYVGDKLPTHTGLVLTDVLAAEHNPKLTVLPMMEVDEDRDDGWGVFDCEISDRKVTYMVELLKKGHNFQKGEWGGGDAKEPLYVHDPVVTEVKRKIRKLTHKQEAGALMKQRRLSRYFTRKAEVGEDKYEALVGVVEGLKKELEKLNKVVEKQGRMLKKYKSKSGGKFSTAKLGSLRRRKKSGVSLEEGNLFGRSDHDGDDDRMEDLDSLAGAQEGEEPVGEKSLKEGDGVPLLYTKKGDKTEKPHVVLYGSGSNTFYVTEDEVGSKTGGLVVGNAYPLSYVEQESDVVADKGISGSDGPCGTEVDFGELNRLVGVITREVTDMPEEEVGKGSESPEATNAIDGKAIIKTWYIWISELRMGGEGNSTGDGDRMGLPSVKNGQVLSGDEEADGDGENDVLDNPMDTGVAVLDSRDGSLGSGLEADKKICSCVHQKLWVDSYIIGCSQGTASDSDGNGENQLMELSDSSPCQRSEKHKPVEREAELAALLLAKEAFTMEKFVPTVEDVDQGFFETVLSENPKVLHLNAGKFDLDNEFFLDLAAPQKWHIEVLVEYVAKRHEEKLKERRCLFLPPWFVGHLQGKARSFNAARVVWGIMGTVSKMLPYLVANVCPPPGDGSYTLDPLTVERMGGAYENRRSGDCGPVAVKFMEMHALGNPNPRMDGLTDELVDIMRKQWAMDLYKDWVLPVYVGEVNQ
ncbi:hypothetical protein HID58_017831 [Brassica napus]|uniref:Ubiquitin-like protease family profile domain-containing protein n=1 Tax=Brassica napus TaxID=3708 RepID=A0ABQ8D869_BRANA|nr:hypothetical protein HID58_017831 [Brassica napus]